MKTQLIRHPPWSKSSLSSGLVTTPHGHTDKHMVQPICKDELFLPYLWTMKDVPNWSLVVVMATIWPPLTSRSTTKSKPESEMTSNTEACLWPCSKHLSCVCQAMLPNTPQVTNNLGLYGERITRSVQPCQLWTPFARGSRSTSIILFWMAKELSGTKNQWEDSIHMMIILLTIAAERKGVGIAVWTRWVLT